MSHRALLPLLVLLLNNPASWAAPDFEKDVKPILHARCVRCHGGERVRGELDVRSRAGLLRGGEGGPAVSPGASEKSLLWIHVAADRMPPGKEKLPAREKRVLREWIEAGAPGTDSTLPPPPALVSDRDRAFWAFRPPVRPALPPRTNGRAQNPLDIFLLAELDKKGLTFSPETDRRTLLRRLALGLTGLPPTPEEVEAFLGERSPDAYEKVVDRLLASPAYGERWGRHWLDVAGYADSEGILDADYVRTAAWRYRDWVLAAINADRPHDRFLMEQIAGDELTNYHEVHRTARNLPAEVVEGLVATGFLRCASDTSRPDFVNIKNAPGYYYQTLDDTVKILASATMGLTLHCARCHGHKFDPIPQSDYYRVQAIFMGAYRPAQWVPQVQRRLFEATAAQEAEARTHNARLDAALREIQKKRAALTQEFAGRLLNDGLARLPAAIREDVRAAVLAPPAGRTEIQKYLAGKFEGELRPKGAAQLTALRRGYPEYARRAGQLDEEVRTIESRRILFPEIRALYDLPGTVPTRILRRGDYLAPGAEVQPGVLAVLGTPEPFSWTPTRGAASSGRRLAFARWLTQPGHPLTARVLVNRVWLHHFGEGLVATPENFGRSGAVPSHPELLDWLAVEFVQSGWSWKRLHRLIVTSAAYRQSSTLEPARHARALAVDPDNRLLWRQRLRRLEAEALRDSLLAVAGLLHRQMNGPPVPMQRRGDGEVVTPSGPGGDRRSVYLQVRRSQPLTILQVFDQPVMETNCTRRPASTVASQALNLLNSDLVTACGEAMARRLGDGAPLDLADRAMRLALGRPPGADEKVLLGEFLAGQSLRHGGGVGGTRRALADLCQMLLASNEFAYLD